MTTAFAALNGANKPAPAPEGVQKSARIIDVPFAMLDPDITKEAGRIQDFVDKGVGAVGAGLRGAAAPWVSGVKNTFGGLGDAAKGVGSVAGGMAGELSNAVASPFNAVGGALRGATARAGEGLGGFVEGGVHGVRDAFRENVDYGIKARNQAQSGVRQVGQGAVRAGTGALQVGATPFTAPLSGMAAAGAATGAPAAVAANKAIQGMNGAFPKVPQAAPMVDTTPVIPSPNAPMGPPAPANYGQSPAPQPAPQPTQRSTPRSAWGHARAIAPRPPAPPASPPPAAAAAPTQGPDNAYLSRVMGSYNPNSPLDTRKADAIRQIWQSNGGHVSPNQIYADPRYSNIKSASAFATLGGEMEKEGSSFLRWGANMAGRSANKAQRAAKATAIRQLRGADGRGTVIQTGNRHFWDNLGVKQRAKELNRLRNTTSAELAATSGVGMKRQNTSRWLNDAASRVEDFAQTSPNAYMAARAGGATALGGGLVYGGHRLGRNSGLSDGYDAGADYGVEAAMASRPQDPGILGRLADVFTGQEQGDGGAAARQMLMQNKDDFLAAIAGR